MTALEAAFAELKRQFDESGRHYVQTSDEVARIDGTVNVRELVEAVQGNEAVHGIIFKNHMVSLDVTRKMNGYLLKWSGSSPGIEYQVERNGMLIAITKGAQYFDNCLDLESGTTEPCYKVSVT